ncbi:flagellar hook-length control protein FliK [Bordetella sp. N]|uniref:flagellar hook-length control protein FliK n=1 Tax=Bordetella sp. N TaxID=1746199 RepID=UPI00070B97AD|nr:flagellar hook-length control protein FliK [Bordetella sp. N]ALM83178.1 hypothetical protein ASB57_09590 [Bordetella sp. N]
MTAAATTLLNIIAPASPAVTGSASRATSADKDSNPAFADVMSRQRASAQQDDRATQRAANNGGATSARDSAKSNSSSSAPTADTPAKPGAKDTDTPDGKDPAAADQPVDQTLSQQALAMAALVAQITAQPAPAPASPPVLPAGVGTEAGDALAATLASAAASTTTAVPVTQDDQAATTTLTAALATTPSAVETAAETAPVVTALPAAPAPTVPAANNASKATPLAAQDNTPAAPAATHVTRQAVQAAADGAASQQNNSDKSDDLAKPAQHVAAADAAPVTAAPTNAHEALANAVAASQAPVTVQAAPVTTALHVATPVGQAGWAADLSKQVVVLSNNAQQKTQTAELRLDPPDLGPLRITLTLNDGVAQASFVSSHAAVRQALEAALPQLQQALSQAGISLGQTNVGDQGAQAGFAANDQGGRQGQSGRDSGATQGEGSASDSIVATVQSRRAANSLVDTFA